MTLEVVYGETRERSLATALSDRLADIDATGTVYLGYPVLATADVRVYVDALLVSDAHGLVAFQLSPHEPRSDEAWLETAGDQDTLYNALESHLSRHDRLRRGRRFAVPIETVTVFPTPVEAPDFVNEGHFCSIDEVRGLVETFDPLDRDLYTALEAALQRVTTIKPAKRRSDVSRGDSRGAVLKVIEREIANLDFWQKQAAIETPDGPQRIRGLAGSGKTIVLALKAAYLHAQHPDWRIAVTFQSRSLYQQFEDLITRFTFEHSNDQPDFSKLQILHAWGSRQRDGVYRLAAERADHPARDWNYASSTFRDDPFGGACAELNQFIDDFPVDPLFDAVLIDEAQDLPSSFFRLVYRLCTDPKRIAFAYDELQNLSESAMPVAEELFGSNDDGEPLVTFDNEPGEARRDIVLPVCYRNSPWALTTAHAIGFGIYRQGGLVQHFDGTQLWSDIGYTVRAGELSPGYEVQLRRSPKSTPRYFQDLLNSADAVVVQRFETAGEQDRWVADQIQQNLTADELEADDVLIVLPSAYTSKSRSHDIAVQLARRGIESHLVGVGSSVDEVFLPGSVAMAHIHRAKGNEAPMVYIVDGQYGMIERSQVSRRNALFTGITRSRAWVRISGFGSGMDALVQEVAEVRAHDYALAFRVPTPEELLTMRTIHRDRGDDRTHESVARSLDEMLELVESGEMDISEIPRRLRTRLVKLLRVGDDDVD